MTLYDYKQYWAEKGKKPAERWNYEKRKFLLNKLKELKFKTVLELGCGKGELSSLIKFFNCHLTGLDISKDRIKLNKFLDKKLQCDVFDYSDETKFDLVICSHFLLHIEPDKVKQIIKKMIDSSNRYVLFLEPDPNANLGKWEYYNFQHDYFMILDALNQNYTFIAGPKIIGIFVLDKKANNGYEFD